MPFWRIIEIWNLAIFDHFGEIGRTLELNYVMKMASNRPELHEYKM